MKVPPVREVCLAFAAMLMLPVETLGHGDLHAAIERISAEIRLEPANSQLYVRRAELHLSHRDAAAALLDLDSAARLKPEFGGISPLRARTLLRLGKIDNARDVIQSFLSTSPKSVEGLTIYAAILTEAGDRAVAAEQLQKVIASGQADEGTYLQRARLLLAVDDKADARAALETVKEGLAKVGPVIGLQLLAIELEVKLQQFNAAVERIEIASGKAPRPEVWMLRKANVLYAAQRTSEAQQVARAALSSLQKLPAEQRNAPGIKMIEDELNAALSRSITDK